MNKLQFLNFILPACLVTSVLFAAPGDIDVTLESSPDLSTWTTTPEGTKNISSTQHFRVKIVPTDGGDASYSNVETPSPSDSNYVNVNVGLESSTDLSAWSDVVTTAVPPTTEDVSGSKKFWRANVRSIYMEGNNGKVSDMVTVGSGTSASPEVSLSYDFLIGRYEVSREEWDVIYNWAIIANPAYDFYVGLDVASAGGCLPNHPVTKISWYDAVKWCNALSEKEGLTPVYYTDATLTPGSVYRTGNVIVEEAFISTTADGYRLPWENEWLYAAAGGDLSPPYDYSGSSTAADVAIYDFNSSGSDCDYSSGKGTYPLASKAPNHLGIYDMSGNVAEYINDYTGITESEGVSYRNVRIMGGYYDYIEVLLNLTSSPGTSATPETHGNNTRYGFRIARTLPSGATENFATFEASTTETTTTTTFSGKSAKERPPKKSFK